VEREPFLTGPMLPITVLTPFSPWNLSKSFLYLMIPLSPLSSDSFARTLALRDLMELGDGVDEPVAVCWKA
jgi:hypothetical protein